MHARLFFLFLLCCTFSGQSQSASQYAIIPRPAQLEPRSGAFMLTRNTVILVPFAQKTAKAVADTFAHQLNRTSGLGIPVRDAGSGQVADSQIRFQPVTDTALGKEGYRLDVTEKQLIIEAAGPEGFFYAVQTLYQLLPPAVLGNTLAIGTNLLPGWRIPACRIQDQPRYVYRGMHLDVSRHFFPVSFIKRYIDLMALHKFNNFHWHLTDDQGWRIEIKKYPKLTQVGAQRRETLIGHYDDYDPQVFDGKPYGGFYTQDDVREVVRYAASKFINVVPEIEMPGHALAALAAYPELACAPGPYQTATKWGVFNDVFCPTEKTFSLLEDVLIEVMALFPSQYIHIGGDECPKVVWKKSAFCQQLMKRHKLKNENQLQSWFITRIDKFVTSKGRRVIGWDEILEGGLSPNATVMSWRGTKGGMEAARQHHDVIMTPGQFCYLDHYQGDPGQEPLAFGGSLPLSMVYSYNPTPVDMPADEARHILGTQGNVWTEYLASPNEVEYAVWPRAAALAEVAWTAPSLKNYDEFKKRLLAHFDRLSALRVNFARTILDVTPSAKPTADGNVLVTLTADSLAPVIRYTTDGSVPSSESARYEKPFPLNQSTTVRAATFRDKTPLSQLAKVQKEYLISLATGKPYTLLYPATTGRPDKAGMLTDGTVASMGGYEVADVVSFAGDFGAIIDLGKTQPVKTVLVGFLKYTAKNTCLPKLVDIAVSDDGKTFRSVLATNTNAAEGGKRAIVRLPFEFNPTNARYVRIIARNVGNVPAGLRYPGRKAQLMVDEIEVR
ncbi:glycoside hydrolase family 20 protein [Spirosoma sp. KUDC1026]|uniref:glycoside hydrolase family 20 protein n=1 Tax=Spirosoma sp. KUDC1026 TaxID=2745947 RepID=UPI00159BE312|nr:glycoside hydrolase family 20 protein [Spirosoma sp. KUDC1026]QKZ12773.1 family 20 glycosylhydrolase [Spirosoma sp. KUDC1026]